MGQVLKNSAVTSLMLHYPGRGNPTMNSKRGLMTVLVGLAMLATPIAAAAKDHRDFHGQYVAPAVVGHNFRNGATYVSPGAVARHDWRERNWNRGYYGAPGYAAAPIYPVAAPYYGGGPVGYGGYGGGGGCGAASRVMRTYQRDRATGHPAAAYDVLRQNQWALHSGCATGAPVGGGLLGGLGGYRGAAPYGGGYNGGGYNGGYGQPYGSGSMLAPLMQYFH
jgi:hypothetical protein